jgi:hypothetical protein
MDFGELGEEGEAGRRAGGGSISRACFPFFFAGGGGATAGSDGRRCFLLPLLRWLRAARWQDDDAKRNRLSPGPFLLREPRLGSARLVSALRNERSAHPLGSRLSPGPGRCCCQESLARFGRERGRVLGRDGWRQKERRPCALPPPRPRRREKHGAVSGRCLRRAARTNSTRKNYCGAKCSRPGRKRTLMRTVNSNNNA